VAYFSRIQGLIFLFVRRGGGEKRASQKTIQKVRRKNHVYNFAKTFENKEFKRKLVNYF
jgi:hypothetical protein